jgi:pilus assembly protein Flp/PilA
MIKLISKVQAFIQSEEGATAIEYGLIAGGISLAIVAAVFAFGNDLGNVFNTIGGAMQNVSNNVDG